MKSPVVAVNRGLCIVDHGSRQRRIDKARQRYLSREPLRIQLIYAGAERKNGPQICESFETPVRKRPNHGNVYAFRMVNLIAHRELEIFALTGEGVPRLATGTRLAV